MIEDRGINNKYVQQLVVDKYLHVLVYRYSDNKNIFIISKYFPLKWYKEK